MGSCVTLFREETSIRDEITGVEGCRGDESCVTLFRGETSIRDEITGVEGCRGDGILCNSF